MHPKTNDVVMATHGRGVIILDDISPLRQITQDVLQQNVYFFQTKPAVMKEQGAFGGASTETQFVGANPSQSAKIIYYLKKRHTFGKMTMEIRDMNDNMIMELAPGKSKGINVVNWNFTIKQPRVAKGKTFAFGGLTSPRVPAGKYKVIMTKGKDTYSTELDLKYDPTSILTAAEREEKNKVTMQLYNMTEELAYMVYEIDAYLDKGAKVIEADVKAKKTIQPALDELNKLKESLVITTGDNYVGTADPQLREDLADLYSKVASSFDKPSADEMANLNLILERFEAAKINLDKIKNKQVSKMDQYLEKNQIEPVSIKTFADFK